MPTPALLWAYTDSGWKPVLVDTLGHVQVDALSCANPGNLDTALSKWLPVAKARLTNVALPVAYDSFLPVHVTPTTSPSYLVVYICITIPAVFEWQRWVGGVAHSEVCNSGVPLVAGSAYMFATSWRAGDSMNFRCNATGGTITCLDLLEVVR